jgi:hypothetical protein
MDVVSYESSVAFGVQERGQTGRSAEVGMYIIAVCINFFLIPPPLFSCIPLRFACHVCPAP